MPELALVIVEKLMVLLSELNWLPPEMSTPVDPLMKPLVKVFEPPAKAPASNLTPVALTTATLVKEM